jgi:hypothetical protein
MGPPRREGNMHESKLPSKLCPGDIGEPRYRNRLKASSLIQELEAGTGSTVMAITGNVDDHCPAT